MRAEVFPSTGVATNRGTRNEGTCRFNRHESWLLYMHMRAIWLVLALAVIGCSSGSPSGPGKAGQLAGDGSVGSGEASASRSSSCAPQLDSLKSELFVASCSANGCHAGTMAAAALDLTQAQLDAVLIGQSAATCDGWKLVAPGSPDESLLLRKLEGNPPADCGDPMPPTGTAVSPDTIACVREWIAGLTSDQIITNPNMCETCGGGQCVDFASDEAHCGSCTGACPSGASCSNGQCACPTSLTQCSASCVDLTRDATHCGSCAKSCGAGALCTGSQCQCGAGLATCASGCAELATDPQNCGGCGIVCGPGKLCTPTGCGTQAACAGLTRCGSACVDTKTSLKNCGGCNIACGAGQACVNGTCSCPGGEKLCGGACLDTSSDPTNCGSCGNVCPEGTACQAGVCSCPGGGAACGGDCVDLQTDTNNCGGCGNVCAPGQACDKGHCACSSRSVSFSTDVAPVLERNCTNAGCHSGTKAKASLDLTLSKSYTELVNVKTTECSDGRLLVAPSQPSTSYLVQKLLGVKLCSGTQMPKAGSSLPSADLEAITAWICQGAPK